MILCIVGSQGKAWDAPREHLAQQTIITALTILEPGMVISGGEPTGVDSWAEQYAGWASIPFTEYLPPSRTWEGFRCRNELMAEECTHLLAVRSRISNTYGSGWTADFAEKLGKKVWRVMI